MYNSAVCQLKEEVDEKRFHCCIFSLVVKQGQKNCSKYDNNLHLTILKKKLLFAIEKNDSYNPFYDKELGYMCQTCLVWQIPISKPVILAATLTFFTLSAYLRARDRTWGKSYMSIHTLQNYTIKFG